MLRDYTLNILPFLTETFGVRERSGQRGHRVNKMKPNKHRYYMHEYIYTLICFCVYISDTSHGVNIEGYIKPFYKHSQLFLLPNKIIGVFILLKLLESTFMDLK